MLFVVIHSLKNFSFTKKVYIFAVLIKIVFIKQFITMLNQYETVFIVTPVLSEAQMKEAVEKFKSVITDGSGEIVHQENWGLKKLAYPIQKKSTGFYNLLEFKAPPELIQKLETEYRRDERIIRFLTFKMEKYAIEYSEKKRRQREGAAASSNEKKMEE